MADDVEVRRKLKAAPDVLFRAFTDPSWLSRWFSPSADIATEVLEHDLREGGRYRLAFHFPGGEKRVVCGEFFEVTRPRRLVFSWTWEPPDPHAGIETRVTVSLEGMGNETEVLVRHERFPDEETRLRHDEGWAGTLERLADLMEEVR